MWMTNRNRRTEAMYDRSGRISASGARPHRARTNTSLCVASPQCRPHPNTLLQLPNNLHNELRQSDYSGAVLLSVIITRELKLKTFVSYYFNRAISTSPR